MKAIRTKGDLESLITDGIEEDAGLEFKVADALGRSDGKKREITKDVSAFANSAGGTIIYGIRESSAKDPPRMPDALDPVDCREISKEWMDQIVGQIRPRIPGVEITAIHIGPTETDYAYVVDIPQGSTAHQALDLRYYARRNFESTGMEDYEVRDVMHRAMHPTLSAVIRVVTDRPTDKRSHIALKIRNDGAVMARHYLVLVRLPIKLSNGTNIHPEDARIRTGDGQACWTLNFANAMGSPLFPGSEIVVSRKFTHGGVMQPDPGASITDIEIAIYADNMPCMQLNRDLATAEREWT